MSYVCLWLCDHDKHDHKSMIHKFTTLGVITPFGQIVSCTLSARVADNLSVLYMHVKMASKLDCRARQSNVYPTRLILLRHESYMGCCAVNLDGAPRGSYHNGMLMREGLRATCEAVSHGEMRIVRSHT